jgi:hypothetical protein
VQLAYARLLGRLLLVDEASGELDADGVDGRAILQDDDGGGRAVRVSKDSADGDGVDAGFAARLAGSGFPDARFAGLVGPGDLLELNPGAEDEKLAEVAWGAQ